MFPHIPHSSGVYVFLAVFLFLLLRSKNKNTARDYSYAAGALLWRAAIAQSLI
jgi:hypothetical protein